MHARFVRFRLKPGAGAAFESLYAERILPALARTEGCVGVALLSRVRAEEELVSATFWRGRDGAEAYDRTGRFARLLNEAEPLLAGGEGPDDLSVEGFSAELLAPSSLSGALVAGSVARTATVRVAPGKTEEFDRRYRAEVAAALADFPGLFAVLLLHGVERPGHTVGLSLWRGEDAAARYDLSGRFEELSRDLSDTISPVARWRAAWAAGDSPAGRVVDFDLDLFQVRAAVVF